MDELIISVSGLRGIIGTTLTPDVAVRYVAAFASSLPEGPVLLTRDGRATGHMLGDAVRSALLATGHDVVDGGIAATPTAGILVRHHQCVGGVQVSASHNPAEYNGLKLFGNDGRVIPGPAGQAVIDRYQSQNWQWVPHSQIGTATFLDDTTTIHRDLVLGIVDVERIKAKGFRVLLDANHGSGSVLGLPLLESLGCHVDARGGTADGQFAHRPEPTVDNLTGIAQEVASSEVVVGFCQDPDADRLALIDENGRYVGEEYTLAVCVDYILRQSPGPVVTNCSSSRMTEDLAQKHGVEFYSSAVGEANVVDQMLACDAVLGGEGAGGVIDPRVGLIRDSYVGMALVLDAMASRDLPLSALVDELPRYAIHKTKVTVERSKIPAALDAVEMHFDDAQANRRDGLRLDWSDNESSRWLLIRASNTEPIVRVIAEAPTLDQATELCDGAAAAIAAL